MCHCTLDTLDDVSVSASLVLHSFTPLKCVSIRYIYTGYRVERESFAFGLPVVYAVTMCERDMRAG